MRLRTLLRATRRQERERVIAAVVAALDRHAVGPLWEAGTVDLALVGPELERIRLVDVEPGSARQADRDLFEELREALRMVLVPDERERRRGHIQADPHVVLERSGRVVDEQPHALDLGPRRHTAGQAPSEAIGVLHHVEDEQAPVRDHDESLRPSVPDKERGVVGRSEVREQPGDLGAETSRAGPRPVIEVHLWLP
jgi:hypothetical protein